MRFGVDLGRRCSAGSILTVYVAEQDAKSAPDLMRVLGQQRVTGWCWCRPLRAMLGRNAQSGRNCPLSNTG
ncbi:MAG: hypothetical protein R3A44_02475 [Caldilineaceae bacterium]